MGERVGYQMVDHVTGMQSCLIRKHWYVGDEPRELEYFIKRIKKALDKRYDLNEAMLAGCQCSGDEVSWLEFDHYFEYDMGDHGVYQIEIISDTEWHLNHYSCDTSYIHEPKYICLGWFRGGLQRYAEVDWSEGEPEFYWHFTEDDDPYMSGYFCTYRGPGVMHRDDTIRDDADIGIDFHGREEMPIEEVDGFVIRHHDEEGVERILHLTIVEYDLLKKLVEHNAIPNVGGYYLIDGSNYGGRPMTLRLTQHAYSEMLESLEDLEDELESYRKYAREEAAKAAKKCETVAKQIGYVAPHAEMGDD